MGSHWDVCCCGTGIGVLGVSGQQEHYAWIVWLVVRFQICVNHMVRLYLLVRSNHLDRYIDKTWDVCLLQISRHEGGAGLLDGKLVQLIDQRKLNVTLMEFLLTWFGYCSCLWWLWVLNGFTIIHERRAKWRNFGTCNILRKNRFVNNCGERCVAIQSCCPWRDESGVSGYSWHHLCHDVWQLAEGKVLTNLGRRRRPMGAGSASSGEGFPVGRHLNRL